MFLLGIPETFNVDDFCKLLQNRYIRYCKIWFDGDVSETYINNFEVTIEEMKKNWTSNNEFPDIELI